MTLANEIIDSIYAAALDAQLWPEAVRRVGHAVGAQSTAMILTDDKQLSRNLALSSGAIDQPWVRDAYRDHFGAIDPAVPLFANMPIGEATTTSFAWSPRVIGRDEFYNDFYARLTLRDSMGAPLLRHKGCVAFMSIHRDKDSALFDENDLDLFRRYMPHLRQSLLLHRQIVHMRRRAETLEALFERLSLGVALVDGAGKRLYLNRMAQILLARADGLIERGGIVQVQDRDSEPMLQRLIADAAAGGAAQGGGTLAIPRNDGRGKYQLLIVPHRLTPTPQDPLAAIGSDRVLAGPSGANPVLLLIRDPQDRQESGALLLRRHFGLTATEATLLEALAFGERLDEFCQRRGISSNTGRFHLRGLFAKTGTHRQSDLLSAAIRLLADFAPFPHLS